MTAPLGDAVAGLGIPALRENLHLGQVGTELHDLVTELFSVPRSITGDGVRETLRVLAHKIPLDIHEVPSGTPVLDWTVPEEWNLREAFIEDASGQRVVDTNQSNLHVVGYSEPTDKTVSLDELLQHVHTLPDHPDWIPYRTTYYTRDWGFCMSERQRAGLTEGQYRVRVDATLEPGSLTYGEYHLPGERSDEVLVSCHVCHPSLANDNLSGIAVVTKLAALLSTVDRRNSYRFLFIPGTIGALTWLARNEDGVDRVAHGLVVSGVGDAGALTYKRSRRGDATIDRAVTTVLAVSGRPHDVVDFSPYGYDERQFCSPGFDLPVGRLSRTPHGEYPEYHTSADDLDFVRAGSMADSLAAILEVLDVLEHDAIYLNLSPKGEPQLGRRGLYGATGGLPDQGALHMALLWVLNQSDGDHSLLDITQRSGLPFEVVRRAAEALLAAGLLRSDGDQ